MLRIVGFVFIGLSLITAIPLLLYPFNITTFESNNTVWALYPVLLFTGMFLASLGSDSVTKLYKIVGGIQLVMACIAALCLVAHVLNIIKIPNSTYSIWYILGLGLILGVVGSNIKSNDDEDLG